MKRNWVAASGLFDVTSIASCCAIQSGTMIRGFECLNNFTLCEVLIKSYIYRIQSRYRKLHRNLTRRGGVGVGGNILNLIKLSVSLKLFATLNDLMTRCDRGLEINSLLY
jgi:hypothetical protein